MKLMKSKKLIIFIVLNTIVMGIFTFLYIITPIFSYFNNPFSVRNYSPGEYYVLTGAQVKNKECYIYNYCKNITYNLK